PWRTGPYIVKELLVTGAVISLVHDENCSGDEETCDGCSKRYLVSLARLKKVPLPDNRVVAPAVTAFMVLRQEPTIVLEGGIAVGKSTLSSTLGSQGVVDHVVLEPVDVWFGRSEYLGRFHDYIGDVTAHRQDQVKIYRAQVMAMNTLSDAHSSALRQRHGTLLFERSIFSAAIFSAASYLSSIDRDLLIRTAHTFTRQVYPSDTHVIYLRCDPQVALQRCLSRGRQGEEAVTAEYLQLLHEAHEAAATTSFRPLSDEGRVFVVDVSAKAQDEVVRDVSNIVKGIRDWQIGTNH
ncbi:MAG: deoxynucleoside kinase, partial [Pseudoalteromonas sp.]|nr:deoxynucleoside kinase [Pseudoalteromonas sp.]